MEKKIKLWEPPAAMGIKGTVFIIHGMGEYSKRYEGTAGYLNDNGYRVAMIDHAGHGNNIKRLDELGLVKDEFKSSLEEIVDSIEKIRDDRPLFILGHSMGSFMAQILLERGVGSDGFILSGSTRPSKVSIKFGYFLSGFLLIFRNKRDLILNKLLFGRNNLKFTGDKKFRWLSRDEKMVEEYEADPLCGFIPYTSYFKGLFYLLRESLKIGNKRNYIKTPVYIFSGSDDPVGVYGSGVEKLYEFYKKIGYRDITLKLYTKGRHEMLNEVNRREVCDDLLTWLDRRAER
ncbi:MULTISPECIES: alpha/beta fold hydrolase [Psychrilyobacter]|nr:MULTISPECIES: alpha/beta fold hydrolase [Psychrilyobacter]MCS5420579.1 lysophospholipase [Psychrilyobacter sp. S5]NDI76626.1 alpha/beta hydrolase [Psychrilyobacter piezotolerans]